MGLFCANFHFRTTDDKALAAALAKRKISQFHVLPAKNGWVSLYEEEASEQDDRRVRDLAKWLSKDLKVPTIAFMCHDSDIACYWLYDAGKVLDEFNSCPEYFDEFESGATPTGGDPKVLVRYCKTGVQEAELAEIMGGENLFAETIIEQLAEKLGIDPGRAIDDYRCGINEGPEGFDDEGSDDDDDEGNSPDVIPLQKGFADKLAGLFGGGATTKADPQALAFVEAASDDDVEKIEQLLAAGVAFDVEAPVSMAGTQFTAAAEQMAPGNAPKFPMTPLMAAVFHKRHRAAKRLIEAGANPNDMNSIFGSAVHAAVGAGDAELLQLLIDHGGDTKACNSRGQTPLDVIAVGRTTLEKMAQLQTMMKKMGMKMPPGLLDQAANVKLPLEGWDACEKLLKGK